MKKTKENAITLVALVITIIVLLILTGVSIQAINNTGLFANAKKAKEKSMEGQLKEEITLAIQSIQTEEIYKGNSVTLETLAGGQLEEALTDITAELDGDEINGEYKNYEYTIDSNLKVTVNGEVSGAKITGTAEVQTAGYVFEGNTVDVKVIANVTEGTITGIVAPEGATLKTDTSTTEKVYTVSKSGTYIFKVTTNSGKTKNITAKIYFLYLLILVFVFRRKQGLLCLLKMVDRFVDFIDRAVEPFTRQTEIPIEFLFKIIHIFLKMGNVNILIFDDSKLLLIPQRIQGSIAQQRDHRDKKLRTDHIHLRISIGNVHDAGVIQLAVWLQHGH